MSQIPEAVLLRRAVNRGLLPAAELRDAIELESLAPEPPPNPRFGPRLDRLVQQGRISTAAVLALIVEEQAAQTEQTLDGEPGAEAPPVSRSAPARTALRGSPQNGNPAPGSRENAGQMAVAPTLDGEGAGPPTETAPADEYPVSDWGRYEFLGMLGQGGMGAVYKARDRRLGRIVALKFIRSGDPRLAMRFLQEARAQSRVDHPGVCKVYEVGEVAGKSFIAMQFVDGKTLDKLGPKLSLTDKVLILIAAAEAMHAAHKLGIIHRDLKPSNIIASLADDGRWLPVIMDFGLAREAGDNIGLTESGAVMGTPNYMSPEQARGEVRSLDRRTDVYSLGATLYDLVGGSPPFADSTIVQVILKVMYEDPPLLRARLPAVPVDLETIILKCLSKEPDRRYPTVLALSEDLQRFLKGDSIVGRRASLRSRLRRLAARNRMLVAVSALSLAVILGLTGHGVRSKVRAQQERTKLVAKAQLTQRLGQDIKDIEWILRAAYQLPLHDIGREQTLIRQRMAELEARQREVDPDHVGLIHYALGRGYLALHELDTAHRELLRAQAAGVDLPEMHYALGRVLGEIYKQQLAQARRSGEKEWLASRQKQLEEQYLGPALTALGRSRSAKVESAAFLEGLVALYRRQFDTAVAKAQRSIAETPWLYEALQIEGDVYLEQATEQRDRGDYQKAEQILQHARQVYARAADIGRSDASVYDAIAAAWLGTAKLDIYQDQSPVVALSEAIAACEKSNTSAPRNAVGYINRAHSYFWLAWTQLRGQQDPRKDIQNLITQGKIGISLNPNDEYAYDVIGNGYQIQGSYERDLGENPEISWQNAEQYLQKAISMAPNFPWAFNDLGLVYLERGRYLDSVGRSSTSMHTQAINYFSRAIDIYSRDLSFHINLLIQYSILAEDYCLHGKNPRDLLDKSLEESRKTAAANQDPSFTNFSIAKTAIFSAEYLLAVGEDPTSPALIAQRVTTQLLAKNPQDGLVLYWDVRASLVLASYDIHRGVDPAEHLKRGHLAVSRILEQDRMDKDGHVSEARLYLLAAEWAMQQGASAKPLLLNALAAARLANAAPTQATDALEELARVQWRLAKAARPHPSPTQIAEGLTLCARALQRNPDLAQCHAIRGALLSLQAEQTPTHSEHQAIAAQAQASFTRALTINPLLRNEYSPYIESAVSLLHQDTSARIR